MAFENTARDLLTYTIQHTSRFPKRYWRCFGQDLVHSAKDVYSSVLKANAFEPQTAEDWDARLVHFKRAKSSLKEMISILDVIQEPCRIRDTVMAEWARLADHEDRLLNGIIAHDKSKTEVLFQGYKL